MTEKLGSSAQVMRVLQQRSHLNSVEIRRETGLSADAARSALQRLERGGFVRKVEYNHGLPAHMPRYCFVLTDKPFHLSECGNVWNPDRMVRWTRGLPVLRVAVPQPTVAVSTSTPRPGLLARIGRFFRWLLWP